MATKSEFYSLKPFFDGNDFFLWKHQMECFLDSDGIDLWEIIESGFCINRPRGDWNENDLKLFFLNLKAKQVLRSSLCDDVYVKIASCSSAQDIWNSLDSIYVSNNYDLVDAV